MSNTNAVNDALSKYRELKENLAHIPSSREFYVEFSKKALGIAFEGGNAYSQLQRLAGDSPNQFSSPKSSLDDILIQWGKLARETIQRFEKLPIQDDWVRKQLAPTVSGIEKSHKVRWSDLPILFYKKFSDNAEWEDVLSVIPVSDRHPGISESRTEDEACYVYLMKDLRNRAHKIGISGDPWKRESTLQSEQPKAELIAIKRFVNRKMALAMEKSLHNLYSHKKKRGEQFDLDSVDIDELIKTLDDPIG